MIHSFPHPCSTLMQYVRIMLSYCRLTYTCCICYYSWCLRWTHHRLRGDKGVWEGEKKAFMLCQFTSSFEGFLHVTAYMILSLADLFIVLESWNFRSVRCRSAPRQVINEPVTVDKQSAKIFRIILVLCPATRSPCSVYQYGGKLFSP